jgi:hypothetical protein
MEVRPETVAFLAPDAGLEEARAGLVLLWEQVYERLSQTDRADLGAIHVGRTGDDPGAVAWAQTNADEDRVNLTLELKPKQLELNIVGWKEAQAEHLKGWLQSVPGEKTINALAGYAVVAFARRAYKKTPESKPWWQDETIELLGSCEAAAFNAGWVSRMMAGLGSPKEVKPAFHVRRAWGRHPVPDGERLVAEVTDETVRLLPVLREIWASSRSS